MKERKTKKLPMFALVATAVVFGVGGSSLAMAKEKNSKLWDKMWGNMSEEQNKMTDYHEIIRASKVLTQGEKSVLLKEQKRLDELEREIAKYYEMAEDATEELNKELVKNQKKIQEIKKETQNIWSKVYKEDIVY